MKRYLVFSGLNYYASGGMDDFIGDYDDYLAAVEEVDKRVNESKNPYGYDNWGHIYDTKTRELIYNK